MKIECTRHDTHDRNTHTQNDKSSQVKSSHRCDSLTSLRVMGKKTDAA